MAARLAALITLLLAGAGSAAAQQPDAPWRTVETRHFRVHYPAPAEAWSRLLASRLEAIRGRVVQDVGFDPEQVVDVVVMDPSSQSNGSAWPLLGSPRMVLWPTPPPPQSLLGNYTRWPVVLALHEEVHLVHLLRPSRNPLQRLGELIVPLGPIVEKSPRWVVEGYATELEGALTGAGRPHASLRAAILRRWAQEGRLPTYGRLSSDSGSWLGMSMAYLVGSAYLEWLQERVGPDGLRHLWRRLTARTDRSFDEAFTGVFGEEPGMLYGRFTAELTWKSVEAEHRLAPSQRDGELWQHLTWGTGAPAVSPDGSLLAIVLRDRDAPPRLVVWGTAPEEEALRRWEERQRELLARDREDVAAVRGWPLPREARYELPTENGAAPEQPRFMPDASAILLVRSMPRADGTRRQDLFLWAFRDGTVRRITRGAGLSDPDPAPDGRWAVAVRTLWGATQLVRVHLSDGEVEAITPASVDEVVSWPRLSPDGKLVAFVRHQEGRWHLIVRDLERGGERELAVPGEGVPMQPEWEPDGGALLATVGLDGFIDVFSLPLDGAPPRQVTRTQGAALAPATDRAAVFFLSLEPHGLDLRHLTIPPGAGTLPPVTLTPVLAPAVRLPVAEEPPAVPAERVPPSTPYGLGRQEPRALVGGKVAPSGRALEGGLRLGDVVGRSDLLVLGSLGGEGGLEGGGVSWAWRGWPVTFEVQAFRADERPSRQPDRVPGLGRGLDGAREGVEAALAYGRQWLGGGVQARTGVYLGRVDPRLRQKWLRERVTFLAATLRQLRSSGVWGVSGELRGRLDRAHTAGAAWHRWAAELRIAGWRGDTSAVVTWRRAGVVDPPGPFALIEVGGLPGSLLPSTVLAGRAAVPALPLGTLLGERYEGQRIALSPGRGFVHPFYERYRVGDRGVGWGDWLALAGLEVEVDTAPMPLLDLPALTVRAGAARVLDEPLKGQTQWWLALAWHP